MDVIVSLLSYVGNMIYEFVIMWRWNISNMFVIIILDILNGRGNEFGKRSCIVWSL